MTVKSILGAKGRDVLTSPPHRTVHELARTLAEKGIGAIVVTGSDGEVLGIISERDVVRAVARGGVGALDEPVSRHMTQKVVTCVEDQTIVHVMERMTHGRFRHMPVTRDGRLIGIVSIGDIVKHRVAEMENEQQALREYIASA
ncbi:MAG: CBS domain-containing protein [Rhizobiales bacterium]|nr:CBS domain-containing protein [Hyphomicrobiales bacterium]